MDDRISKLSDADSELLELGALLGQNHAFGLVAGRCSAAQAQTLRDLREKKKYKRCTDDWREFCSRYLNISGGQADKIIALLDNFGPSYFQVAQLTRVSPETYRLLAPSVKDGALHVNGEAIELNQENARKVAAAVAQLRRQAAAKPAPENRRGTRRLSDVDKRFAALITEMREIIRDGGESPIHFSAVLQRMSATVQRLCMESGVKP